MAFTAENSHDAYLFFVLAFDAAPGKEFGGQIYQAYDAGATTQQIVNTYATKDQFKAIYPDTQTSAEFAAALINNVVGNTASDTAKDQAVADIVAAMGNGLGKGDVIYAVLGNLSKMDTANADWGKTVAMLNNKIAVAKALTEGDKALNTTDLDLLHGPLTLVTANPDSVAEALNSAGDLATKLDHLAAANKAKADYEKSIVDADGNPTDAAAIKQDAVDKIERADLDNGGAGVTGYSAAVDGLTGAALVAKQAEIKQTLVSEKDVDAAEVASLQAQVKQVKGLQEAITARKTTADALTAAEKDLEAKTKAVTTAINTANADKDATVPAEQAKMFTYDNVTGTVSLDDPASTPLITVDHKLATGVTEAKYPGITAVLNALKAEDAAASAVGVSGPPATGLTKLAEDAAAVFKAGGDFEANSALADNLDAAQVQLAAAQKAIVNYDAALAELGKAAAIDAKNTSLDEAIAAAKKAFTDAGLKEPVEVDSPIVSATDGADIFLPDAGTAASQIVNFGLQGKDVLYVGKGYELGTDLAHGNDSKLEVFFKANGVNTDVYVEQKAFGSSVNGAVNGQANEIVKITLTGVSADKLVFKDGFISVAA